MEVTQTQRNSLTDKAEGRRSETIILHRLYSPNRLVTELKYYESNGIQILERLSSIYKSSW